MGPKKAICQSEPVALGFQSEPNGKLSPVEIVNARQETDSEATSQVADVGIVSENTEEGRSLERRLKESGLSAVFAGGHRDALDGLTNKPPKIIILDSRAANEKSLRLCESIRGHRLLAGSYILLACQGERCTLASTAIAAGADDFISNPGDQEELLTRVRIGLRFWTLQEQLRFAATTDSLTGLFNHDTFHRSLANEFGRSRRYGRPMALVMLDLDFFKAINDTYGHPVGNTTLQAVSRLLRECVRDCDVIGRLGGEEFGLVLPESTLADARQVAERLRIGVRDSLDVKALRNHVLTISSGIADSEDPRITNIAQLIDLADRALYLAKRRGRDQVAEARELDDGPDWTAEIRTDEIEALRRRLAILSTRAKDVYVQSVSSLLQALNEKDPYTARHALNVAFYAQQIAEGMHCTPATTRSVYNAALLHDIGKVGVPDKVLMKTSPLTDLERMIIEQVPMIGTRIVDHLRILEAEVQIIRHQREYFDGTGGPARLVGPQIPIGARILLVADAFDAMTTDRVYRSRKPISMAVEEIAKHSGKQFDPEVVKALRTILGRHYDLWQQRIDDTVRAMRLPSELTLNPVEGLL